jgi:hypothetical protein
MSTHGPFSSGPVCVDQADVRKKGYHGAKFEMLERLVDLRIFISHDRAEVLARRIIEGTRNHGAEEGTTGGVAEANETTNGRQQSHDRHDIHSWNDPDCSILDDRRGDLPDFPIDTLPAPCQEWVKRAAHGAGADACACRGPVVGDQFQPDWDRASRKGISIVDTADDHLDGSCGFFRNEQDARD